MFLNATYTTCEDAQGCAMVQGCVSDKKFGNVHRVYWKAKGDPISKDPKRRKVCRGQEETPKKQERGCKQP